MVDWIGTCPRATIPFKSQTVMFPIGSMSFGWTHLILVYPVATRYSGSKALVIDNTTILGGSQSFLGIVYIIVGLLCTLLGFVFLAIQITRPRYSIVFAEACWFDEHAYST